MTGRKLTASTIVRNPDTGVATFLEAGTEAPEWAADMLGDHLYATATAGAEAVKEAAPAPSAAPADPEAPEAPAASEQEAEGNAVAYAELKKAELRKLIDDRNAGRPEAEQIKAATSDRNDDLVAALVADDAAQAAKAQAGE